jgi:hypothetical protein
MTQYSDKVEEIRLKQEAEEWANGIKYIHANKGIIETKYQNGNIHYEDTKTHRKWTVFANHSKERLVQKFVRWIADRSHYGK